MLYCPKCQKTYDGSSQRFCLIEGERLVSFAAGKSASQTSGIFTNVLKRKTGESPKNFSPLSKLSPAGSKISPQPDFHSLTKSSVFKTGSESEPELELELPKIEPQPLFKKPLDSFAESDSDLLGEFSDDNRTKIDDQTDPIVESFTEDQTDPIVESFIDEEANFALESVLTPENLVGQSVNERYRIVEQIGEDESGVSFLAEDETVSGKQFVVKILSVADDSLANQVFAEERAWLLKLNHPNIVNTIDAGELSDGKPFLVTEYVEGETVKDHLKKHGQFNALRAARVVRQTADALDKAHRNNVLHRNLNPESIILTVDENGTERVRLKNFGAASAKSNAENLPYKSPEQVEGKIADSASDIYSLGVVAYQMLTDRLPFDAESIGDLLKLQREGIGQRPSDVRFDLPLLIDEILEKALSFYPLDRYSEARNFGDVFFSEIIANLPLETEEEIVETTAAEIETTPIVEKLEDAGKAFTDEAATTTVPAEESSSKIVSQMAAKTPVQKPVVRVRDVIEAVKATEKLAWEKRSSDTPHKDDSHRNLFALLGVAAIFFALLGVWYYISSRPTEKAVVPTASEIAAQTAPPVENFSLTETNVNTAVPTEEIESPPVPRQVTQPPDSLYFQSSKAALKGDAAKNYLGFSLYYPTDWTLNNVGKNFLDISKKAPNGLPIEQLLISYYNSKGTFKADEAEIFPAQVIETNTTLKKILPNYKMISEGKKTVNNGWQAYEVKFEGASQTATGETIKIWGKRLFIPTAIRGTKNGYVITMLATSFLKDVKRVEDVGVKGELSTILETFEPNQNF